MTWIAPPPIPKGPDTGWTSDISGRNRGETKLQSLIDMAVLAAMTAFLLGVVAGILIGSAFHV